jgi:hypothetical protein
VKYIVDEIGSVVDSMRGDGETPYYIYGNRLEISNRLLEKDKDKVFKHQKYPLIALRMDIPETMANGVYSYSLNIAILDFTDQNYTASERYEKVFKPVLYPLYESFIVHLKRAGFMWPGNQKFPPHTKIDRPFWGLSSSEKNVKNLFNDPLDAIELIDLKISKHC